MSGDGYFRVGELSYDTWHRIDVEALLTKNQLQVSIDGKPTSSPPLAYPTSSPTPASVIVQLGVLAHNVPHPGVSLWYDDVRIEKR